MANPNPRPTWDVHSPHSGLGQTFVKTMRKIYHPVGFQKGYNFPLFIIFAGALFVFVCARLMYFDHNGVYSRSAIPGEFYYYRSGHYAVGIMLHIVTAVLAAFFAPFQFIPIIRYKLMIVHRINGYWAILLLVLAMASAFMLMPVAVSGTPIMRIWTGTVGTMILIGVSLAYINIKRLQIEAHRMWMLRVWTWAGAIVTLRLILLAARHVSEAYGYVYHFSFPCAKVFYMYTHVGVPLQGNPTPLLYPTCLNVTGPDDILTSEPINPSINIGTYVSVSSVGAGPENVAALLHTLFPMGAWLAIAVHVIAVETYLWLTPAEHYRLRNVSYQHQVEAGLRPNGQFRDSGINASTVGDAPEIWSIPFDGYREMSQHMGQKKTGTEHIGQANDTDVETDGPDVMQVNQQRSG